MFKRAIYLLAASVVMIACGQKKKDNTMQEKELTMVVGTYTNDKSKGIYTFRFNQETAEYSPLSEVEVPNPSYLVISEDNNFVYAVSENGNEKDAVNAFAFDVKDGTLKLLNRQPSMGIAPCYIISNGKNIVTANYGEGNIAVFPVRNNGFLLPASDVINFTGSGTDLTRQETPHLHCVQFTPDGKCLFANDLGTDQIYKFTVNEEADAANGEKLLEPGSPNSFKVAPESGPRHIVFSPNGKYAYLINELSGMVMAFQYNHCKLNQIQTIAADTVGAKGSGDIHISPDGKFLYASNRLKADGLAIFSIDENGLLNKIGYQLTGIHPRNFIITPNGKFLLVACRDNDAIEVYKRNMETGLLTNKKKDISLSKPVCIKFAN